MIFRFLNVFPLGIVLCLLLGCAGGKSEQKPTPPPVEEKKVEQSKGEETNLPQPPPDPPAKPVPSPTTPPASEPPKTSPPPSPTPPDPQPSAPIRVTKILWESVNLREGPGLNFKVIGTAKRGTSLTVLEEKGSWLKVKLPDGKEAWVSKAATSDAPKAPPASPAGPSKPKPM